MTDQQSSAPQSAPQCLLFLCSGNYYRSRFAEYLFNFLAQRDGLRWEATSRGLSQNPSSLNVGPISSYTRAALAARGIQLAEPVRMPQYLSLADLAAAHLVVALKEAEHRPLMQSYFSEWADRIDYWNVHDLDCAPAEAALPEIERLVGQLMLSLKQRQDGRTAG